MANATTGVNTVLRGIPFTPQDVILYFDFVYGACGNTVHYIAATTGAKAVKITVPLPATDDEILAAFEAAIPRDTVGTTIALFDTIVSLPGIRLPFERLIATCRKHNILSLVDAAHGVGHIPLDLAALDPDFFTSNCHKWLFVPRGCAFLYVAPRNRGLIKSTLPTSWGYKAGGATSPLPEVEEDDGWAGMFTFVGTVDGSANLCVPAAIKLREKWGGEERIMKYTWQVAREGAEKRPTRIVECSAAEHCTCPPPLR